MSRDVVIGTTSGLERETLSYWMNSLDRSGFAGDVVVLIANGPADLVAECRSRGYECVTYGTHAMTGDALFPLQSFVDEDVSAERFRLMWDFLSRDRTPDWRYVISADMRDLVFQDDPSRWLEANLGDRSLAISSEALTYDDEPWNGASLLENFGPAVRRQMGAREIWNAGFIGGQLSVFRDLCLNVHLLCRQAAAQYGDQAAVNITLGLEPFRRMTHFVPSEAGWACHAGTLFDPAVEPLLREPRPTFDGDFVYTHGGKRYCAVHQYDRVAAWHQPLWQRYRVAARSLRVPGTTGRLND